jgi:hypothetical protein
MVNHEITRKALMQASKDFQAKNVASDDELRDI